MDQIVLEDLARMYRGQLLDRILKISEREIAEFTLILPINPPNGSQKIGELTYTELVLLTTARLIKIDAKGFDQETDEHDNYMSQYNFLLCLIMHRIEIRLDIQDDCTLDYCRDYSLVKLVDEINPLTN